MHLIFWSGCAGRKAFAAWPAITARLADRVDQQDGWTRRLFQRTSCKFQFSATIGTLFHDSHLPLTKWFAAISLMSDGKKGISASSDATLA
jgi:hypothetical protein